MSRNGSLHQTCQISARYPDIRIRFLSAIWPDDFHTTRADVEIRFGSQSQVGKNATLLTPNELIALKSPRLKGTLTDLPLIEAVGTSSGWRHWAQQIGDTPAPSLFADSYGMALHLAATGNGVALATELLVETALRSGQLERAHPGSIPAKEGYYLSQAESSTAAAAFCEWFKAKLSQ